MRLGLFRVVVCCSAILLSSAATNHQVSAQDSHEQPGDSPARSADLTRSTGHREGLRQNPGNRFAIVGSTVHRAAGVKPQIETILIRGSLIEGIGKDLEIPAGTKIIDRAGKHSYPGLIDAYSAQDFDSEDGKGTAHWNGNIQPQLSVAKSISANDIKMESMRNAGFTAALIAPSAGIMSGQSSLVLLSNYDNEHLLLAQDVAQHFRLTIGRGGSGGYPNSPMGAVALARQTMHDAAWYQKAWQVAEASKNVERPEVNQSLAALQPVIAGQQMVMIETSNELFVSRADRFAREFGLKLVVLGNGNEYRRLDEIVALDRAIVLPINFPKAPDVSSPEMAADVSLEDMMHWDHAPENPGRLAEQGVTFAITSKGLESKKDFLSNLRTAVKRGLTPSRALAAVTSDTAKLYGVDHLIGTLEKSKIANITMTDEELFSDKAKIVETWVDGVQFEVQKNPLRDVVGQWKLKGKGVGGKILDLKSSGSAISGEITLAQAVGKTSKESGSEAKGDSDAESKTSEGDADAAKTAKESSSVTVKPIALVGTRLTGAYRSDTLGKKGISLFSMIVSQDGTANGTITFPDGSTAPLSATMQKPAEEANPNKEDGEWDEIVSPEIKASKDGTHAHAGVTKNNKRSTLPATYPVNYPLGAFGRSVGPEQPKNVLIKNVTIWTLDERGKIENGAVLFGDGWIQSVFAEGDKLPKADLVIDGKGAHLTPGIIDCHSHMATDSGVNESGQAITAEVRIGDMIDCDDITIYRQLAGGVTTANILHGSSNPIGGQNQVIKLRWGANEESMKFADAPQGIKFALGENVKRSRSSSNTRYPNTRMGVEQLIDDAFRAAKDYQADWKNWETNRTGLPPRRDLELDTLAEIVDGKRWVHCHSYRQDEILALMRTLEEHNITIGSFQHILEGYKVANEMAKHGAMASAFADWWAYKYEVKDAIPYAGALMHQAGVVVSFNSDDGELARHLNHEAAKAVKYGGVPEVEALKFVTLNPARQLRIEERVGSIEIGKEADMVLWSGHPLSNLSVAQQTWIDGRKYFDRKDDQKLQATTQTMRLTLIQKILESGEDMQRPDKSTIDPAKLWPRYDEFCHGHSHEHDD